MSDGERTIWVNRGAQQGSRRRGTPAQELRDGCWQFHTRGGLNTRKEDWADRMKRDVISDEDFIRFAIGLAPPEAFLSGSNAQPATPATSRGPAQPARAAVVGLLDEVNQQFRCLMTALIAAHSGRIPPHRTAIPTSITRFGITNTCIISGYRNFARQRAIWIDKFNFVDTTDRGAPVGEFGKISDDIKARYQASSVPRFLEVAGNEDVGWHPREPTHRAAWGAGPTAAVPSVPHRPLNIRAPRPAGAPAPELDALSTAERSKEILVTSSAPGTSRHHWATDIDILSVEQSDWDDNGGRYLPIYQWLDRGHNAAKFGFFQPFKSRTGSSYGTRYSEERWHWSYYPIAQAIWERLQGLLTPAASSASVAPARSVRALLESNWGSIEAFQWIQAQSAQRGIRNWQNYIINIDPNPVI